MWQACRSREGHDGLNVDQISMNEGRILLATGSILIIVGCQQPTTAKKTIAIEKPIHIELDQKSPGESKGNLEKEDEKHEFRVGYGKNGVGCKGSRFQEGVTPLGKFKVNAILSKNKFLIDNSLVKTSGRTKEYLKQNLFNNMSSIDFKGDGQTGEYGSGYISLTPVPATPQPFTFNTYDGKFRWYSFAIHGTNEESRIGKRVTGGCINMKNEDIDILIENINLGDEVVITSPQSCNLS